MLFEYQKVKTVDEHVLSNFTKLEPVYLKYFKNMLVIKTYFLYKRIIL